MIKLILAIFFSLTLSISSCLAGYLGGMSAGWNTARGQTVIWRATCASDISNLTTYTFSVSPTGLSDDQEVLVAVVFLGEDSATDFGVNSATIDGVAALEAADENGSGMLVSSSVYFLNASPRSGMATFDITATWSEPITGAVACAWAYYPMQTDHGGETWAASISDNDTASAALTLTLSPNVNSVTPGAYMVAACATTGIVDSTTWAVATEREDTQNAEFDYSSADAAMTTSPANITCDWTGTQDAAGSAIALNPNWWQD